MPGCEYNTQRLSMLHSMPHRRELSNDDENTKWLQIAFSVFTNPCLATRWSKLSQVTVEWKLRSMQSDQSNRKGSRNIVSGFVKSHFAL